MDTPERPYHALYGYKALRPEPMVRLVWIPPAPLTLRQKALRAWHEIELPLYIALSVTCFQVAFGLI